MIKLLLQMIKFARKKVVLIWIMDIIEMCTVAITPWLIANAIDGLIDKSSKAFIIFVIVEIFGIVIGTLNRFLDTRVYSKIIQEFSVKYYDEKINRNLDISTVNARLDYIDDLSGFLESDVPNITRVFFGIVVSMIYLYCTHSKAIFISSVLISCVSLFISYKYKKKSMLIEKNNRDIREFEYDVKGSRDTKQYANFISKLLKNNVRMSDIDSKSYFVLSILQTALLALVVYSIVTGSESAIIGTLFASITYVVELNGYIFEVPEYVETYMLLKDSSDRLNE